MVEKETGNMMGKLIKWGAIIFAVLFIIGAIGAIVFVFFFPSFFEVGGRGEMLPPTIPEIVGRLVGVVAIFVVFVIFIVSIIIVIYELFFKKKELHIVQEHHKIVKESTMLNPVRTMGNLVLSGQGKIQHYTLGKIVGHTQVPVKFERQIILNSFGKIDEKLSENEADFKKRKKKAEEHNRNKYDFFAFLNGKGVYGLPLLSLLEPVKIFACYPGERSLDLVGDVEVYDVGTWKISGVNIFVPAQRNHEPMITMAEFKSQLMPIAHMGLMDYLGLIAQRGVEGDTGLQRWLQTKATNVNVKESSG